MKEINNLALNKTDYPLLVLITLSTILFFSPNLIPVNTEVLRYPEQLAFGVLFWLTWFALLKRVWLAIFLGSFVAIFIPFSLYLRWQYSVPINPVFTSIVLDTNWSEVRNFLSIYGYFIATALILLMALVLTTCYLSYQKKVVWSHRSKWWILPILPIYLCILFAEERTLTVGDSLDDKDDPALQHVLNQKGGVQGIDKFQLVFPFEIGTSIFQVIKDERKVNSLRRSFGNYKFGVVGDDPKSPDVVVFVIGESARMDRWHLFGYSHPTTPLIEKEENVIPFSNVVTPSVATRYAVPNLVSRNPIFRADGSLNKSPEPSFLKAFKEAGYLTYWVSNQSKSGYYDTPIDIYAEDADFTKYINVSSYFSEGTYDEKLIPIFAEIIKNKKKSAVVLHLMGSHFNYAYRYPKGFDKFRPSLTNSKYRDIQFKNKMDIATSALTNNSYDNSILYTDFILSRLINLLKEKHKASVLFYISDHGEDVFEPKCDHPTLSRISAYSYHVPALIWMSDDQRRKDESLYKNLDAHKSLPMMSENFSMSILSVTHIVNNNASVHGILELDKQKTIVQKVYAAGRWVEYGEASKKDACIIQ